MRFVSYLRVSTEQQGKSGLGLEAQRVAVQSYLDASQSELVAEYVETESGRRDDRPELARALRHAKRMNATLVIAKLDRLARSAKFLLGLLDSGVSVAFCDLPSVPAGPTGRFILTQMAAVAELEAGLISERTKAALTAAKARGKRLGNPNGAASLRAYIAESGNGKALAAIRDGAQERAERYRDEIERLTAEGITTLSGIADAMNAAGETTPRGGTWTATAVKRLQERLATA